MPPVFSFTREASYLLATSFACIVGSSDFTDTWLSAKDVCDLIQFHGIYIDLKLLEEVGRLRPLVHFPNLHHTLAYSLSCTLWVGIGNCVKKLSL